MEELREIKGVGPETAKKLEENGLGTLMGIATSSPTEISTMCGISENKARTLIKECRGELKLGFEVAKDFAKRREKINKIGTGCIAFDEIIDGGFESGAISECYGQFGCLSGDTIIRINRCEKGQKIRLDRMYNQLHNRKTISKNKRWLLDKSTYTRTFDGTRIGRHKINDVMFSGEKEVFKILLENGYNIKATKEHKILTDKGWIETQQLTKKHNVMCDTPNARKNTQGLKTNTLRDFSLYNTKYHPFVNINSNKRLEIHRAIFEANINNISLQEYIHILDNDNEKSSTLKFVDTNIYVIHHKDNNHYNNNIDNLQQLTKEEHLKLHGKSMFKNFNQGVPEFVAVKSITSIGIEKTYDIVCEEPYHNFNAGDMIVHNSGKTQVAHLMVVRALKENKDNKAIFIDTENTFRDDRIKDFAKANELDEEDVLNRIYVSRAYNSDHQMLLIDEVEKILQSDNTYRILVVDSLTSHFRSEFIGRGTLATRQQKLNKHMHQLLKIADLYNIVVLCSNQVMSSPTAYYGDPTTPVGGHIVGHNSTFRIYMRPGKEGSIYAKLIDSPNLPQKDCNFWITKDGFSEEKPKKDCNDKEK